MKCIKKINLKENITDTNNTIASSFDKIGFSYNGITFEDTQTTQIVGGCIDSCYLGKDSYIVCGKTGLSLSPPQFNLTNMILSINNGKTWTNMINPLLNYGIYGLAFDEKNSILVSVGRATLYKCSISFSKDLGKTWYTGVSGSEKRLPLTCSKVCYSGNMFYCVGSAGFNVWRSMDGETWKFMNFNSILTIGGNIASIYNNGLYLLAGSGPNIKAQYSLAICKDGNTWDVVADSSNIMNTVYGITYNPYTGMSIIAGSGNYSIAYSYNGEYWIGIADIFPGGASSICFNGFVFFSIGIVEENISKIAWSNDGINWNYDSKEYSKGRTVKSNFLNSCIGIKNLYTYSALFEYKKELILLAGLLNNKKLEFNFSGTNKLNSNFIFILPSYLTKTCSKTTIVVTKLGNDKNIFLKVLKKKKYIKVSGEKCYFCWNISIIFDLSKSGYILNRN